MYVSSVKNSLESQAKKQQQPLIIKKNKDSNALNKLHHVLSCKN